VRVDVTQEFACDALSSRRRSVVSAAEAELTRFDQGRPRLTLQRRACAMTDSLTKRAVSSLAG